MRIPAKSAAGNGGGIPAVSQTPPLSYRQVPVRTLRALPIRDNPRLEVLDYRLTAAPGMKAKPRTHGHGAARLPGGFILALCITQADEEGFLEIAPASYDEMLDRQERVDCSPQMMADLYRSLQRRQIMQQGKAYGRSEGHN